MVTVIDIIYFDSFATSRIFFYLESISLYSSYKRDRDEFSIASNNLKYNGLKDNCVNFEIFLGKLYFRNSRIWSIVVFIVINEKIIQLYKNNSGDIIFREQNIQ